MTKTEVYMAAELKGSHTRFMMLLTSRSWARPSVPCSQGEGTSILCGLGGGPQNLPLKFVSTPNFATKSTGEKYPKFCLLNFRYDPKNVPLFASCGTRPTHVFSLIW